MTVVVAVPRHFSKVVDDIFLECDLQSNIVICLESWHVFFHKYGENSPFRFHYFFSSVTKGQVSTFVFFALLAGLLLVFIVPTRQFL